ncbi:hypothetical protein B7C42_01798 [Nocardia cerradoensis]|uniref:Uncharacterized protein n=1 Tax=Nocardia cerradoensis TaxID=85688 RepID=A0A231HD21_9NOCA|nr:hypothetical protein B7C42_01798 [Nocardia cerradoensis]
MVGYLRAATGIGRVRRPNSLPDQRRSRPGTALRGAATTAEPLRAIMIGANSPVHQRFPGSAGVGEPLPPEQPAYRCE